jgi:hypothetical protein
LTGFQSSLPVGDKIHVLGLDITKNYKDLTKNFEPVIDKIRRIVDFWSKFRLSLMGRINVAKCLMLSQLSYLGSILDPEPEQLSIMQEIIDSFIVANMKFSKNYVNVSVRKGGLGMIDLTEYLIGLKCSWIKRCNNNIIDIWRNELNDLSKGNILQVLKRNLVEIKNRLLYRIACSFEEFKCRFFTQNNNWELSNIIGNPLLINNKREKSQVNLDFLYTNQNSEILQTLQLGQLAPVEDELLPQATINQTIGKNLTDNEYETLKICLKDSLALAAKKRISTNAPSLNLNQFMNRFKKGSKPFRKILGQNRESKFKCKKKTTVVTFFRLINENIMEESELEKLNSLWNNNCLNNKWREFILKFRNNLLGLNTRVSHFNINVDRGCTFCRKENKVPVPDETFIHLFYQCPSTSVVINKVLEKHFFDMRMINETEKKLFLFCGINPRTGKIDNFFLELVASVIMYSIWDCKLSKQIPSFMKVCNDLFFFYIEKIRSISSRLRGDMLIGLNICRRWHEESSRRS